MNHQLIEFILGFGTPLVVFGAALGAARLYLKPSRSRRITAIAKAKIHTITPHERAAAAITDWATWKRERNVRDRNAWLADYAHALPASDPGRLAAYKKANLVRYQTTDSWGGYAISVEGTGELLKSAPGSPPKLNPGHTKYQYTAYQAADGEVVIRDAAGNVAYDSHYGNIPDQVWEQTHPA